MKKVTLGNFLTDAEINLATKIFVEDRDNLHKRLLAEIIEPNMERINASLGQQNNAAYLAYGVEYVLTQAEIKR